MASDRFLILFFLLSITACKSIQESINKNRYENNQVSSEVGQRLSDDTAPLDTYQAVISDYQPYRSRLSDRNATLNNDIPKPFWPKQITEDRIESNIGYRIQLISTMNKAEADTVRVRFNNWVFSRTDIRYKAEVYVEYKQPYFRVHVGDFKTRKAAIDYSKQVKRRFKDAWVVQDRIELDRVFEKENY